jgi:monoamine oxidase
MDVLLPDKEIAMAGSAQFRDLMKWLHLAEQCEQQSRPAADVVEEHRAQQRERREFLKQMAAGACVAGVSGVAGRVAWAAPRTSGSIGIVGAGLAGLLCADRLAGNGVAANVYEAGTVVGGRCRSLRGVFPGQVAELGGELIDTSHTTMRGLANAFGLTLEDYEKQPGDDVYYFGGQYYSEAQVVDEFRAFVAAMRHDLTRLSNGPTAFSNNAYDRRIDNMTLADYLDSRGAGRLLHSVIDTIYTGEYGRQIEEQSALAFLMFIHADKRSKFSPLGQFSDERFHVVEGNDRIATGMAARLPSPVKFGQRLVALKRRADGRYQATFDVGSKLVDVLHDVLVLALPFSVLRTVDLDPSLNLSAGKQRIIREHSYGTNSKMMVGFDRRAWIEDFGSNGGSYSDLSHHQNTWETNAALSNGTRGILTDYTGGRLGASLDPSQAQREAGHFLADLESIYPGISQTVQRDSRGDVVVCAKNWFRDPLALGSYTNNAPGYFTTLEGWAPLPEGNLLFAGEHTDSFYSWQGFMEGACLSGTRAASEVYRLVKNA